jgi:hypothetical protein
MGSDQKRFARHSENAQKVIADCYRGKTCRRRLAGRHAGPPFRRGQKGAQKKARTPFGIRAKYRKSGRRQGQPVFHGKEQQLRLLLLTPQKRAVCKLENRERHEFHQREGDSQFDVRTNLLDRQALQPAQKPASRAAAPCTTMPTRMFSNPKKESR